MRLTRRLAALATVPLLALVACTAEESPAPSEAVPSVSTIQLGDYETTEIAVARSPFCDRIAPEAVRDALGDAAQGTAEWKDGEPVRLPGAGKDVAHEFGCGFRAASGMTATAWLFAPPVTRQRAAELVAAAGDCARPGGPAFGKPSVATRCPSGKAVEVGHRGLFGDAWLTCTVGSPRKKEPKDLVERGDAWCVQVLEAVRVR